MSTRVKSKHKDGTYIEFTTDQPASEVIADLIERNGEIASLSFEPITYKGREITGA